MGTWWGTAVKSSKGVLYDIELAEDEEEADRTAADIASRLTRASTGATCVKVLITEA